MCLFIVDHSIIFKLKFTSYVCEDVVELLNIAICVFKFGEKYSFENIFPFVAYLFVTLKFVKGDKDISKN